MITPDDLPTAECQCGRDVGVTPVTYLPSRICAACREPLCSACSVFNEFDVSVHETCEAPMVEPQADPMCRAVGEERLRCAWRHSCPREYACNH